jgi:putative ABC transport system permease protein
MWQFLWEAVVMTFLGAIIGFILGVTLSFVISTVATALGFGWKFSVTPLSIVLACGVSLALGLTFGVFPARVAAKLDPVDALRQG